MKKPIKTILSILLITILSITLTGCIPSKEEIIEAKQYKKQAKINAKNYIKEKYNFEIKILKVNADTGNKSTVIPIPDFYYTGDVYIKAKANNKIFNIYITGTEPSLEGKDDYQKKEIEKDYIKLINDKTKTTPYAFKFSYSNNKENTYTNSHLINEYYDKTNLNEIIKHIIPLELYYINYNGLKSLDLTNTLKEYNNAYISLINFNNINDFNHYQKENQNQNINCSIDCYKRLIIYKQDELIYKNTKTTYNTYKKNNYNNEISIYSENQENIVINTSSINLSKIKNLIIQEEPNIYQNKDITPISDTYSIPYTDDNLHIFFKAKNNLKKLNKHELILAYSCIKDEQEYYDFIYNNLDFKVTSHYYYHRKFNQCSNNGNITFTLLKATDKNQKNNY